MNSRDGAAITGVTQSMGKVGGVLGQRSRGKFLLPPKNRVLPPPTLRVPARCPHRSHGLHRGLVQPPPAQPQSRRHPTSQSPHPIPNPRPPTPGRLTQNKQRTCLKKLTTARRVLDTERGEDRHPSRRRPSDAGCRRRPASFNQHDRLAPPQYLPQARHPLAYGAARSTLERLIKYTGGPRQFPMVAGGGATRDAQDYRRS